MTARDLGFVTLAIACGWWWVYGDAVRADLPPSYRDDALMMLTRIKAYSTGELLPFVPNFLSRLNAPFHAAWSDYPVEDFVYAPAGWLVALLGLEAGTSAYLLILQGAAGTAAYYAARLLLVRRDYAVAVGILFGLAPYAFQRGLTHLNLTLYWHVPLLIVILVTAVWPEQTRLLERHRRYLALPAALLAGTLCPYYLGPFLLLLGFALLGQLDGRDWPAARGTLAVFGAAFAGLLLQNLDTIRFALHHGVNHVAVGRDYWGLVKFGLYLPDLLFPGAHHSDLIQGLARDIYLQRVPTILQGESQTAYIGLVALIGLGMLLLRGAVAISRRRFDAVPPLFWLALGILAFAIAGGLNHLLGAFGFLLLRATNRVSILLAAMGLLYLAGRAPATRLGSIPWLIPVLLIAVGFYDQLPRFPAWQQTQIAEGRADYVRDKSFFRELEQRLPTDAMVFQLPVKVYPESSVIGNMGDYEHFRPWLHTKRLRFSYGTVKGRGDDDWQAVVAAKPPAEMLADLERYGFAALSINRRAYVDGGAALASAVTTNGRRLIAENADFLIFQLKPHDTPKLPRLVHPLQVRYGDGFHSAEQDGRTIWYWARAAASVLVVPAYRPPLYRPEEEAFRVSFRAGIEPVKADRAIWLRVGDQPEQQVLAKGQQRSIIAVEADVTSGSPLTLHFRSERRSVLPAEDYRWLNFRLIDPQFDVHAAE